MGRDAAAPGGGEAASATVGRPHPLRVGRSLSLAKKTHQDLEAQGTQFHQGLLTCPHPNLQEPILSQ